MENPFESPQTPLNEPGKDNNAGEIVRAVVYGIYGFFAAGVTTSFAGFLLMLLLGSLIPGYAGAVIGGASPVVIGPLVGIGFWLLTRDRVRAFGRGALVFSVTSFLTSGGCLLLVMA